MRASPFRAFAFLLGAGALLSVAASVACGSSGARPAPAEGGLDSAGPDGLQGPDATPGDAGTEAAVGSGALAWCQGEATTLERCGVISPACGAALYDGGPLTACAEQAASIYTQAALQQVVDCGLLSVDCSCLTTGCSEAGAAQESAANTCLQTWLEGVSPSPAAEMLALDFCAVCPDTASNVHACSGFFSLADAGYLDAGAVDASAFDTLGFGSAVLVLSDSALSQVDTRCTGAALSAFDAGAAVTDCYQKFLRCSGAVEQGLGSVVIGADASLPPACQPDAGAD